MSENSNDDKIDQIRSAVQRIDNIVTGAGRPEAGMILRLDRIEQYVKRVEARENARSTAVMTAALAAVGSALVAGLSWLR